MPDATSCLPAGDSAASSSSLLTWVEEGVEHRLRWQSEAGVPPPGRVVVVDDATPADFAYRLACEGTGLLWRGDFQNARQLLQALARRIDRQPRKSRKPAKLAAPPFHLYRQAQAQRARILGLLLIPVDADYVIPLRRAPDVAAACREAYGPSVGPFAVALRELQGLIGAHEWRKKGVAVPAAGGRIHPHYGVFSPVRSEYVELVARAPLPGLETAFDIGTGTGVLAAVLARRGVRRIVATDQSVAALACARENLARLGYAERVDVLECDLFPPGKADLIVCNPPWLPGRARSRLEAAVYDPDSRMLLGFLRGLGAHLHPAGEGWLILSDLAVHLGLRAADEVPRACAAAGLTVLDRIDTRPMHPRTTDAADPLHAARARETTSLWRLAVA